MSEKRTRTRTPNNKTTTGFRISDELWEVLQPRGKPVGRQEGTRLTPRARRKIICKKASQGSRAASRPN